MVVSLKIMPFSLFMKKMEFQPLEHHKKMELLKEKIELYKKNYVE